MVAIKALLALSTAVLATAAPSGLNSRGQNAANLKFFGPSVSTCDAGGPPVGPTYTIDFPPPTSDTELLVNICYPHSAWGSAFLENIAAGCKYEQHISGTCADVVPGITTAGCVKSTSAVDGFFRIACA